MKKVRTKLFETVTQKVKAVAQQFDPNAEVILFGSRARGDYRKDSDWDFLILTDLPVHKDYKIIDNVRHKIFKLELEMEELIFSLVENKTDWSRYKVTDIHQNITDDGIKI
jgi:predicted nucleotidyltransferase